MDERRKDLLEQREELDFALLMDEYAEKMGGNVRREAEEAFEKGELEYPQELDAACHAIIKQARIKKEAKRPMKAITRYVLVAAAAVVLLLGSLMIVQAAGVDIFGKLGTWTEEFFSFAPDTEALPEEAYHEICDALQKENIPTGLCPRRLPRGAQISEIKTIELDPFHVVAVSTKEENQGYILLEFCEYQYDGLESSAVWFKSEPDPEIYTSKGRTFYLFTNIDEWVGVWSDGRYEVSFSGFKTKELLKKTIDSMEVAHEN